MYTKYMINIYKITIVFNGRKMFDIVSRIKKKSWNGVSYH